MEATAPDLAGTRVSAPTPRPRTGRPPSRLALAVATAAVLAAACGGSSSVPGPGGTNNRATSPAPPVASPPSAPPPGTASASPSGSGQKDFFESFDNNDNDWPTRTDSDGTKLAIADGTYNITLPAGSIRYIRPSALAQRSDVRKSISMTAQVTVPPSAKSYAFGLGCRMSPADKQYYIGRVFQDGKSALVRRAKGGSEKILKSNNADPVKIDQSHPTQLVLLCGLKDGTMKLTLTVNGKIAVEADDPDPLPENPPGIYAVAGLITPTSSFAYDNILVSQYTP